MKRNYLILFILLINITCTNIISGQEIYIRVNQLGFLPGDIKTAIVFSDVDLIGEKYFIIDNKANKSVFEFRIENNLGSEANFNNNYSIDFSSIRKEGEYYLEVLGHKSHKFSISHKIYNGIVDSLLLFFKVQRCGPTNPHLHEVCHLWDVSQLVNSNSKEGADLTGGWHDAGDYIKFLSTTSYSTYLLLFSYEFDKNKFSFDIDKNGVPDILDEAKIGLDWLLRANVNNNELVTQVQDLRDHEVGWRMPENDSLKYDRPGYVGMGKNVIGLYTATLAIGARIWREKFNEIEFSDKLLSTAERIYSLRISAENIDVVQSGMYQDSKFEGKMALGSIEMYLTTNNVDYLNEAKNYADIAGADYWWSWGDINSLAHYRLASFDIKYSNYIMENLNAFNIKKISNVYGVGMPYTWGTTNSLLGISLKSILWKRLTQSSQFDSLAIFQRDFVLGKNQWGVSFVYNIGTEFIQFPHSQIAFLNGGYHPGALSAGPATEEILANYQITRTNKKYNKFNTTTAVFYDDTNDYVTNEPTIVSNATAIFVFGYFSSK